MNLVTLLRALEAEDLTEVHHNLIIVSINQTYREYGDDFAALYESTRGIWAGITEQRARKAQYIAGVADDRIVYLMTAAAWLTAGSTNYFVRKRHDSDDRIEFVGRTASEDIQALYVGRRVPANERPSYYGPFNGKVYLVDGEWLPESPEDYEPSVGGPYVSIKRLVENSLAAKLAAIEVDNKPQMTYRDEVTVMLVVNAWELGLKPTLWQARQSIFTRRSLVSGTCRSRSMTPLVARTPKGLACWRGRCGYDGPREGSYRVPRPRQTRARRWSARSRTSSISCALSWTERKPRVRTWLVWPSCATCTSIQARP